MRSSVRWTYRKRRYIQRTEAAFATCGRPERAVTVGSPGPVQVRGQGRRARRIRAPAVALPRLLWVPAALAFALVALPVVGLLLRADWPRMPELLTSEAALDALRLR